jgi:hypothetical protein
MRERPAWRRVRSGLVEDEIEGDLRNKSGQQGRQPGADVLNMSRRVLLHCVDLAGWLNHSPASESPHLRVQDFASVGSQSRSPTDSLDTPSGPPRCRAPLVDESLVRILASFPAYPVPAPAFLVWLASSDELDHKRTTSGTTVAPPM